MTLLPDPETGSLDDAKVIDQSRYGWKFWRKRVPADRLESLAARVPAMDLTTERSLDDKTHALGEVMVHAISLRNFLSDAFRAGCVVVFG
jgi:hypothetical protein